MFSVVVVDYKTADRCVRYIDDFCRASDERNFSFVIIDNTPEEDNGDRLIKGLLDNGALVSKNSQIESVELSKLQFVDYHGIPVVYASTGENAGFARANNVGAKIAKELFAPQQLLFSNSDIRLPSELKMSILISHLNSNQKYAMVGAKVIGLDGRDQSPGKYLSIYKRHIVPELLWPINKLLPGFREINIDTIQNANSGEVYRIIGAFMLMKTSAFDAVNGFDEHTFLYAEEPILSEKLFQKGFKVIYNPDVTIVHEQGVSTNDKSMTGIQNLIVKRRRVFESELYYYKHYISVNERALVFSKVSFRFYLFKLKIVTCLKR